MLGKACCSNSFQSNKKSKKLDLVLVLSNIYFLNMLRPAPWKINVQLKEGERPKQFGNMYAY
jgi:hypothetical protein